MLKSKLYLLSALFLLSSCAYYPTAGNSGKVPPGQAKKMNGDKSAKKYAPGQKKKK